MCFHLKNQVQFYDARGTIFFYFPGEFLTYEAKTNRSTQKNDKYYRKVDIFVLGDNNGTQKNRR